MNKLIFLLFFIVTMGYAQDVSIVEKEPNTTSSFTKSTTVNTLLSKSDFTLSDGRMIVSELNFQMLNDTIINNILLSVVCQQKAFKEIGIDQINEMIVFANNKARHTLNKEQKYNPTEIKMVYNPTLKYWSLTDLFTVEDQDGKIRTNLLALDFDSCGKFVVMKRVL